MWKLQLNVFYLEVFSILKIIIFIIIFCLGHVITIILSYALASTYLVAKFPSIFNPSHLIIAR